MTTFTKDDGRELKVIQGLRDRALAYRASHTPRSDWKDDDYKQAMNKRLRRHKRLIKTLSGHFGKIDNAEVLEIGCGDGINIMLLGLHGVRRAVGIDLDLRLYREDEKGESSRRLTQRVLREVAGNRNVDPSLTNLPAELLTMDATRMDFPDGSFDIVMSRSVLEHVLAIKQLYAEIDRVLKPGGIVYQVIDPFFWLRGCHKRGLVDIPWAHARLTLSEYHRFVSETEGERKADKRLNRLTTLNRLSLEQWKAFHQNGPLEILSWEEKASSFADTILMENPDVISTLLPGIRTDDLTVGRIRVVLRKRAD